MMTGKDLVAKPHVSCGRIYLRGAALRRAAETIATHIATFGFDGLAASEVEVLEAALAVLHRMSAEYSAATNILNERGIEHPGLRQCSRRL